MCGSAGILLHDQSHFAVNTKVELAELTVKEGFDEVNIGGCRAPESPLPTLSNRDV